MIYHQNQPATTSSSSNNIISNSNTSPSSPAQTMSTKLKENKLNCFICHRPVMSLNSSNMISNDPSQFNYHRECSKCTKCDKYLTEKDLSNSYFENSKYLFCSNCQIKQRNINKPHIQTMISTLNNASPSTQPHNVIPLNNPSTNSLNDLKSKFETNLNLKHNSLKLQHQAHQHSPNNNNQRLSINQKLASISPNSQASTFQQSRLFFELDNRAHFNTTQKRLSENINPVKASNDFKPSQTNNLITSSSPIQPIDSKQQTLISKFNINTNANSNNNNNLINNLKTTNLTVNTNQTTSNSSLANWVSVKHHSAKCNIIMKKLRRGNKRSKSLPTKFNIDSLLDYLNCSMVLNKYELKKLSQQRNLMLFMSSNNQINNSTTSSSSVASSHNMNNNNNAGVIGTGANTYLSRLNRNYLNFNRFSNYQHTSLSSGYNSSDNHSNSSTTTANSNCAASNTNMFNFYRLSLNHLSLNSIFLNTQCTCGASSSNLSNSKRAADLSSLSNSISSFKPLSSSPNLRNNESEEDDDEEDDEDDDEDDLEEDELEDDLSIDEDEIIEDDENEIQNFPKISVEKFDDTPPAMTTMTTMTITNSSLSKLKKSLDSIDKFQFWPSNPVLQRAPGTSTCQHTARIDIRRVRSFKDLSQPQLIFSQDDFVFKEKLGEGFFANVKKIVSKISRQEMVLKELKLNCINFQQDQPDCDAEPLNYAELNSAHKSFLKEAQVLRNLNHPNVIKLLGIMFTKEKHLNLILEFISGGTLKDIIHNISKPLPWKLRVGYARDIASAMQYLHSLNIIHRDLKSDNCLVKDNGRTVVVADFGLSRIINYSATSTSSNKRNNSSLFFPHNHDSSNSFLRLVSHNLAPHSPESSSSATNSFIVAAKRKLKRRGDAGHQRRQHRYAVVGNSFSMAPEMLKHQIYDERVDIFSFGIICCEIIGRVQADPDYLPRTSDFGLNVELFRKKYCEADCPKHFIKIAIACCELEPEKRPPFSKTHLWLETILSHLEANNPIPKNLLKNILDSNTKRPIAACSISALNVNAELQQTPKV